MKRSSVANPAGETVEVRHNVGLEAKLLASAIASKEVRGRLVQDLPEDPFVVKEHSAIWAGLKEIAKRGLAYDRDVLRSVSGGLADVAYADQLGEAYPDVPENLDFLIERVSFDSARTKTLVGPINALIEEAKKPNADPAACKTLAQNVVDGFAGVRSAKDWDVKVGDAIWAPLPPVEHTIAPVVAKGSLALLVAYGASLKTWLALDAALAVARGEKWLGRFEAAKGKALLVDYEGGEWETRRRLQQLVRGKNCGAVPDVAMVTMPVDTLVSDPFYEKVEAFGKDYSLIVVDSLSAASPGLDENSSVFATSLNKLKAIAARTGATILVIHHSIKLGEDKGERDDRELVRGSSAIFNAADVVLQLRRGEEDGSFVVKQTKARGGKPLDPFAVRVVDLELGGTVVEASDVAEDPLGEGGTQASMIERAKARIVELLRGDSTLTSKSRVIARLKGNRQVKFDALAELLEDGVVYQDEVTKAFSTRR